MSKVMGIDYGTKRVGIALSDEEKSVAFPKEVLVNSENLLAQIDEIIIEEGIDLIVLGESKNSQGEDNIVMKEIRNFKDKLEKECRLSIVFEPEFMTSMHIRQTGGKGEVDAQAAALILQRYLDRRGNDERE